MAPPSRLANLDRIIGLPITFAPGTPVLGSIPQAQPETLNASAQATATFNAGGTQGRGSIRRHSGPGSSGPSPGQPNCQRDRGGHNRDDYNRRRA